MTETEQQQREACAELARRMGITIEKRWQHVTDSSWGLYDLRLPGGTYLGAHCGSIEEAHALLPDYFTDPAASRELVTWLLADMRATKNMNPIYKFCEILVGGVLGEDRLEVCDWEECVIAAMTAPLPVIARAACKALGIEVSE